ILYEGAQGTMLDIGAGTYPYVTSSHTIAGGVCVGTGIGPHAIDRILGVSKAYATRVGEGPFTTELHDATGETLRHIGGEYGATTKRPRRCGWLDIVQLRRAVRLNSLDGLILTKLDVLDGFEQIGVCTAYRCGGKRLTEWPANPVDLAKAEPIYTFLPGWKQATTGATSFQELPTAARAYINKIERWLDLPVVMISNGQDRKQLITRRKAF
ncbi:MAG: adenylosuccinate synthetase, partial [Kiritimatiellota bacterium]|nr:adenylosuccinate synthetase [Kiritimatiellota bacterium]